MAGNGAAQDVNDRRIIRTKYRDFMEEIEEREQELINPEEEENLLKGKLDIVDDLFKGVSYPREQKMDAECLKQIASLGKKKAQALQTDFVHFQALDFCERMIGTMTNTLGQSQTTSPHSWAQLGQRFLPLFNKAPTIRFMCGSFERGEVSLKRKAPKEKDKFEDQNAGKATKLTVPSSLQETDREELTTIFVESVFKTLWKHYDQGASKAICFFEFVTHPDSFGKTIENIFYTSFLIREGRAKLYLDQDKLPAIEPIEKDDTGGSEDQADFSQLVMQMTPALWKKIVDTYKIQSPVIDMSQVRKSAVASTSGSEKNHGKRKGIGKKTSLSQSQIF